MSEHADDHADEPGPGLRDAFAEHRNLLFTVAYEMLGSAHDAEDVLQEAWLRWDGVAGDAAKAAAVRDPRAYLVRITTNLALDRLRSIQRRKETYVGPWLPEPLLTAPDVAQDVELADSVSMAMMLVLDTLRPTERAVFLLREVFGFGYDDIAASVGKSEAAVRQILSRARSHVQARRPRRTVEADAEQVLQRFLAAAQGGDIQQLMDVLAPDVVLLSDGGGVKQAALRPITGRDKVLRWMFGVMTKQAETVMTLDVAEVNGAPGVLILAGGELDVVASVRVDDGLVTEIYFVRNPAKLAHLEGDPVSLER
ncbi:RNA polymerase sigma-70 factor [Nocardioides sp. SYSU DS0651]|uniref:RNA polymerase sigma-70 factor n=1 Tax=Nocardioides sp. SYSU DS0651 TaxID=3415955 RepID=UPI003F4BCA1A